MSARFICTIFTIFITVSLRAQLPVNSAEWIPKIYGNIWLNTGTAGFRSLSMDGPSPAIQRVKSNSGFWELGLNRFYVSHNKNQQLGKTNNYNLQVSYEVGKRIVDGYNADYFVSVGMIPTIAFNNRNPSVSTDFYTSSTFFSFKACITGRVQLDLSPRWGLDLNASLAGMRYSVNRNKVKNPALSPDQQITTTKKLAANTDKYNFRLGIFIRIGSKK